MSGAALRMVWERGAWWLLAPLAVLWVFRGVAAFDFVADARFLIAENTYIRDLHQLWPTLTRNYFWSSSGAAIPYWRPLTKLSWLLEYQLFAGWPGGYMLVQLGWFLLGVLGVQGLARGLGCARSWAATAGLLFGLSPVAIEPVCLLMARSDVVAGTAAVWSVLAFLRWQARGSAAWAALHLVAAVLALASKESAVILAPVLTGWVLLGRLPAHGGASPGGGARCSAWRRCGRWSPPTCPSATRCCGPRCPTPRGWGWWSTRCASWPRRRSTRRTCCRCAWARRCATCRWPRPARRPFWSPRR